MELKLTPQAKEPAATVSLLFSPKIHTTAKARSLPNLTALR